MAEGGLDEMEMGERGERFPEYDDLSPEELDTKRGGLGERLLSDEDPLITERITYIENLQSNARRGEVDTNFGGPLEDAYIQLDKFVQDTKSVRLNSRTDSVIELRTRVSMKNGNIMFKERLENGTFSKNDKMVLKRVGDKLVINSSERNTRGVEQFEDLLDSALNESTERDRTTASLPVMDRRGSRLSPDIYARLGVQDQRER